MVQRTTAATRRTRVWSSLTTYRCSASARLAAAPTNGSRSSRRLRPFLTLRTGRRVVRLRTLRALPTHEAASYRLLLDDLVNDYGFVPRLT